jgi:putative hydrolase of the HAD superfamily
MVEITTLFWDVGGVILTNGWDLDIRRRAAEHFNLDWEEMQERREQVLADFEAGRLSLAEYLGRTVFYQARSFTLSEFEAFMFAQSQPHPETIEIVEALAGTGKYLLGAINNESLELNLHRIERSACADTSPSFSVPASWESERPARQSRQKCPATGKSAPLPRRPPPA